MRNPQKVLAAGLVFLITGAFNPAMASGDYFTFGINPVDPTRHETLKPGQCVIALANDSAFPITVKGRYNDSGEFQTDTAYIQAGEKIVTNADGVALYVARCGNDILQPNDWTPEGSTIRCEAGVGEETDPLLLTFASMSTDTDPDAAPDKLDELRSDDEATAEMLDEPVLVPISAPEEPRRKKKWLWILAGIAGGIAVGAAVAHDDDYTSVDNSCKGNCAAK